MQRRLIITIITTLAALNAHAQIGEYRNVFSLGVNTSYMFTSIGFSPKIPQKMLQCMSAGLSFRYTSEKYFTAICSLTAEINWAQMGWNEDIKTINSEPVYTPTGQAEYYRRRLTYFQIPIMAHLAWGQEVKGFNFFIQAGPQFGLYLSESTDSNFTLETANIHERANQITEQYSMPVENKFDYGICAGLGIEYSHPSVGHFRLEGRYYYGLGNIYGASKSDYFGKSNQAAIVIKLAYLIDITRRGLPQQTTHKRKNKNNIQQTIPLTINDPAVNDSINVNTIVNQ